MKKMKTIKLFKNSFLLTLSLIVILSSCEDKFQAFPAITYTQCEQTNVVVNPNIISDFECQANIELKNVETLRNPAEIQINKSRFVGKFIDGSEAWDNLLIDYGKAIDLSTNGVFKLKIRTEVTGTILVKLEGGTSAPIEKSNIVAGDNGWAEYAFNFSDQELENHTKLVIFFNAGVQSGGTDEYFIDDLFWGRVLVSRNDVARFI